MHFQKSRAFCNFNGVGIFSGPDPDSGQAGLRIRIHNTEGSLYYTVNPAKRIRV